MSFALDSSPRLEKYELLEELGHGAMATVYRARDRRLGREVAVKIIHRHLRDEREVKERFASEAKAVAKLRHPNIVEVYDVSEPDETERYLVVELVRGVTLRQLMKEHCPLPPELALGIGVCLADALQHAHEQGVIHRDIKPENVLLSIPQKARSERPSDNAPRPSNPSHALASGSGISPGSNVEVKLTDFGIAKVLDVQGVTSTGEVLGSPAHMAPEQIEGQSVGPRADVFSLGVLLYEAMLGTLPFQGNNPAQVLRRVLEGTFTPVERLRPEVGCLIGRVIDRALAHAPEDRFASAAEFASAMRSEIASVDLLDPMRELTAYLEDSTQFDEQFPGRILPKILERANGARRDGRVPLATALYNRALSLRPGDPSIIAEVARLSRMRKLRDTVLPACAALFLVAAAGTSLYYFVRSSSARRAPVGTADKSTAQKTPETRVAQLPAVVATARSGGNEPSANTPRGIAEPKRTAGQSHANGRAATHTATQPLATRTVQVELRGAKGSRLRIDGEERPWFGAKHELPYGVHRFSVVAPTDNCCVVPEPRIVKVGPGEGELRVVMAIEFRDSTLQFAGEAGSTLTCGELFAGVLEAPGRKSVRLTQAETHGTCTLIPPVDSGKRPRTIDVVLRPGGTFTVNGP